MSQGFSVTTVIRNFQQKPNESMNYWMYGNSSKLQHKHDKAGGKREKTVI